MTYYNCEAERTNARCANENGDVESSNGHLNDRIEQALLLRGSRNFDSREEYVAFVEDIVKRANDNRRKKFLDDLAHLNRLPDQPLDTDDIVKGVRVSSSSTISMRTNTYSVPSRLIDQLVDLRIGAEQITVTHYGHLIQTMPRLVGKKLAAINYRLIIDSLVRKPGAFANYRYREEMFPTTSFRMAWDSLRAAHMEKVADKTYVQILQLAAQESQDAVADAVADALRHLLATEYTIDVERVRALVADATSIPAPTDIEVEAPNLCDYDSLLTTFDKECPNHDQNDNETGSKKITDNQSHEGNTSSDLFTTADHEIRPHVAPDEPVEGAASANDPDQFQETAVRAATENLSHLNYLSELATLECEARREGPIKRLMTRSKLHPGKTWANFKFQRLPLQVTRPLETLRDGSFLDRRENVIIFGRPGSGKSLSYCQMLCLEKVVQATISV